MFLVETNVWLKWLLDQEKSDELRRFLQRTSRARLCLTDLAFYSIALVTLRENESPANKVSYGRITML